MSTRHGVGPRAIASVATVTMTLALTLANAAQPAARGKSVPAVTAEPGAVPPPATTPALVNELQPFVVGYPSRGVALGQAYDLVEQRWLSTNCIKAGPPEELGAGEMVMSFKDLYERKQLFESVKVSVSGEGKIGGFGGSASVEHARSTTVKYDRRNIIVTIEAMKGGRMLVPPPGELGIQLSDKAKNWLRRETAAAMRPAGSSARNEFRARCGDAFAVSIRYGARLNSVFSYAMDSKEVADQLTGGASGGYGPAKAKASFERISKKDVKSEDVTMSLLQVGAKRDNLPTNADDFITYIKTFGTFARDDAAPIDVVLLPYAALGDVPAGFADQQILPDVGVRGLSAHYWRLLDLGNTYARAAVTPNDYYHVFIPPGQPLVDRARDLHNAARCAAHMLSFCARQGSRDACTMQRLAARFDAGELCNDKGMSHQDVLAMAELAVGTEAAEALISRARRFKEGDGLTALTQWQRGSVAESNVANRFLSYVRPDGAAAPAPPPAPTAGPNVLVKLNIFDLWFISLAQAPWPRALNKPKGEVTYDDAKDLHAMLAAFCLATQHDCTNLGKEDDAQPGSIFENLQQQNRTDRKRTDGTASPGRVAAFKSFVLALRLFPAAQAVCETEIDHPMCQLPDVLNYYLDVAARHSPPTFGATRNFTPNPNPPAAQSTKPKRHPCGPRAFWNGEYCEEIPGRNLYN